MSQEIEELQKIVDKEFEYLLAYPRTKRFFASTFGDGEDIPDDAKVVMVTQAINGVESETNVKLEPTLEKAIEKTKAYVDSILKDYTVFVRIMPQLNMRNGEYYIRTRFAKFPKEDTGQKLKEDIQEIESALSQLQHHNLGGTRDWHNAVRWLTELLEIKRKNLEDTRR